MNTHVEELIVNERDAVLRVTINRPQRRNALTNDLIRQIHEAFSAADKSPHLRAIVLTGTGDKAFCAGADLKDSDTPFQFDHSIYHTPFANLLRAGHHCDVPIIGRLNGVCLAGGMGLFGLCDMVVATEATKIGLPEVNVGIFPMQVLAVLRDRIPPVLLAEMCLTGRPISASEALAAGLVNRVVPFSMLDEATDAVVDAILSVSRVAVRRGKYAMRSIEGMSFDQMMAFLETQVAPMTMTEDAREGFAAFAERRKAVWPNQ
jgi:enoyl-CoA hydratase/carnithine racemase